MGQQRGDSRTRRRTVIGFREATEEMFGEEGFLAARVELGREADEALFDPRSVQETWVEERHVVALVDAVFEGPCGRNRLKLRDWSRLQIMRGFGRVKAAMLRVVGPETLTTRAVALWRDEHTKGELAAVLTEPTTCVITLTDHDYVDHPLARLVLTESLRTVVAASYFAKDVTSSYEVTPANELVMTLVWR